MFFVLHTNVSISSSFIVGFNKVRSVIKLGYVIIYSAEITTQLVVKRRIPLNFFDCEDFLKQDFSIFIFIFCETDWFQ